MANPVSGATGPLPIDKLITAPAPASAPNPSAGQQTLGEDAFLKLLTQQLKNQDPLKPVDTTQSIAQLAQFSALQSQNELKNAFQNFQSNFAVLQSSALIGHKVAVNTPDQNGNASTVTGTVKAINVIKGLPQFTLIDASGNIVSDSSGKPLSFSTSQITGLQ